MIEMVKTVTNNQPDKNHWNEALCSGVKLGHPSSRRTRVATKDEDEYQIGVDKNQTNLDMNIQFLNTY